MPVQMTTKQSKKFWLSFMILTLNRKVKNESEKVLEVDSRDIETEHF